jgi:DNA invertase Pin-like site-specific DNA recombinase
LIRYHQLPGDCAAQNSNHITAGTEGVAARHKWDVVGVFEDSGVSGAKGRDQRPGLDAIMKMVARREVDMVAAWSVDRIGRRGAYPGQGRAPSPDPI